MNASIRNGLRAGVINGIVIIFLVLIGFNLTLGDLIGSFLQTSKWTADGSALTPTLINMLIFFGLVGIWGGIQGARKTEQDSWAEALLAGLITGVVSGVLVALLALVFGSIRDQGTDIRKYLAQVSSDAISKFLYGQSTTTGAVLHLVFLTLTGLLGAIVARGISRGAWRSGFSERLGALWKGINDIPALRLARRHPLARYLLYGLLMGLVLLLPLRLGQYWNYTMGTIGIYVLLGLGLNIVVGLAGLLDLGYVAFFAIGAYTVAILTAPEPHHLEWSFWIALPIGIVLASIAGILLGIPVLRLRGDYLAIVTLGFGEIIRILSRSDVFTPLTAGPRGIRNIGAPTLFGKPFASDISFLYLIILSVLLIIFVTNRLQNSRIGRAWIAMREDETVAQAMGINTLRFKLLAFAIGAAFAGLGGVLFASRNQFTGPEDHNLMVSINVLALVIVGGMGSIPGVIAGAFVLKGLPEILRQLENYRILAFGGLLVAMMIIRPEGLIPSARRRLEIHEEEPEDQEIQPQEPVHPASTNVPVSTDKSAP